MGRCARAEGDGSGERSELRSSRKAPREHAERKRVPSDEVGGFFHACALCEDEKKAVSPEAGGRAAEGGR